MSAIELRVKGTEYVWIRIVEPTNEQVLACEKISQENTLFDFVWVE